MNILARERSDDLEKLVALGQKLRTAQARLSGNELRQLTRDRQQLIAALTKETKGLAAARSHPLTDAALRQVEQTLAAALADPEAAAALVSGRLVAPLEHAGIGPVELEGQVGESRPGAMAESAPASGGKGDGGRRALARAEEDQRRAEGSAADAVGRRLEAESELQQAEEELARLEDQAASARRRVDEARRVLDRASAVTDRARAAAEESRRRVVELGGRVR